MSHAPGDYASRRPEHYSLVHGKYPSRSVCGAEIEPGLSLGYGTFVVFRAR
jgi:hypothetical protein